MLHWEPQVILAGRGAMPVSLHLLYKLCGGEDTSALLSNFAQYLSRQVLNARATFRWWPRALRGPELQSISPTDLNVSQQPSEY